MLLASSSRYVLAATDTIQDSSSFFVDLVSQVDSKDRFTLVLPGKGEIHEVEPQIKELAASLSAEVIKICKYNKVIVALPESLLAQMQNHGS